MFCLLSESRIKSNSKKVRGSTQMSLQEQIEQEMYAAIHMDMQLLTLSMCFIEAKMDTSMNCISIGRAGLT
jgi:hypothetical protein